MLTRLAPWLLPLAAAPLLLSPVRTSDPGAAGATQVRWGQRVFQVGDWPLELPDPARRTTDEWSEWARRAGYRMDLDAAARVLVLSETRTNRSVRREMELVERTLEAFDSVAGLATRPRATGDVVERPGAAHVAVLVRLNDEADYRSLLNHLSQREPYLRSQLERMADRPGVSVWRPFCSLWIEDDMGRDEWRAENELVHRLATVLTRQTFGQVPHWLESGLAWRVELDVCRSIYAFPGRDGFVGVEEHKGWERALGKVLAHREGDLTAEDFAAWERGTYDDYRAGLAWGFVTFLAEHRPGTLGRVLDDLGHFQAASSTVTREDGSWERIGGFETPVSVQEHVVRRWVGEDTFAECTRYLRMGSRYRPRAR